MSAPRAYNRGMDTKEFNLRAAAALGGRGWMTAMARALDVHYATVKRWASGDLQVPEYACAVVELLEKVPAAMRPDRFQKPPRAS